MRYVDARDRGIIKGLPSYNILEVRANMECTDAEGTTQRNAMLFILEVRANTGM